MPFVPQLWITLRLALHGCPRARLKGAACLLECPWDTFKIKLFWLAQAERLLRRVSRLTDPTYALTAEIFTIVHPSVCLSMFLDVCIHVYLCLSILNSTNPVANTIHIHVYLY